MTATLRDVFADTTFWIALVVKQDQYPSFRLLKHLSVEHLAGEALQVNRHGAGGEVEGHQQVVVFAREEL